MWNCINKKCDFYSPDDTFNCGNLLVNPKKCKDYLTANKDDGSKVPCSDRVIKQLFDKEVNKMEKDIEGHANRGSYKKAAELTDNLIGINQIYGKLNLEGIAL